MCIYLSILDDLTILKKGIGIESQKTMQVI